MFGPQMRALFREPLFQVHATRRAPLYENNRFRSLKYKSMAKASRKAAKRALMGGIPSPKDTGEELPPFFLQPRYKLLYKVLQDQKNVGRIGRKPIPADLKLAFAEKSKEYNAYKLTEKKHIEEEVNS